MKKIFFILILAAAVVLPHYKHAKAQACDPSVDCSCECGYADGEACDGGPEAGCCYGNGCGGWICYPLCSYSEGYYQGYYQSAYEGYYQGYYQAAYYSQAAYYAQGYYQAAYYGQAAYESS